MSTTIFFITFKVPGGSEYVIGCEDENRLRQLNEDDPYIELTTDEDCIMQEGDNGELRAKMPCGHAIGAQTMYQYLKMVLTANEYSYSINCPVKECNGPTEWDFFLVARVADLSESESLKYQKVIGERCCRKSEVKTCPSCGAHCVRGGLNTFRAACPACHQQDFCWECQKLWKGSGLQICGNENCPVLEIQKMLDSCTFVTASSSNIVIPKKRACPKCLTIMEHDPGCKHIKCCGCGWNFCFSCLEMETDKGKGGWKCGSHTDKCNVAPTQKLT